MRSYASYEQYVAHQKSKLARVNLDLYEQQFEAVLTARLSEVGDFRGAAVLCLGARLGAEVRAFKNLGAFAVGVDLNPGKASRHVLHGDFHELEFPDACARVVYSNSLDHALDVGRVLSEVSRVLRNDGILIIEAQAGVSEGIHAGPWEATEWDHVDVLVDLIKQAKFELDSRAPFEFPWRGDLLQFSHRSEFWLP